MWRRQQRKRHLPLADWAEERPREWLSLVNEAMEKEELKAIRVCAQRGRPYGGVPWVAATAGRLGLGHPLRPPGLPRQSRENE
jgi:orotate phosphoribosyltransferase